MEIPKIAAAVCRKRTAKIIGFCFSHYSQVSNLASKQPPRIGYSSSRSMLLTFEWQTECDDGMIDMLQRTIN